MLETPEKDENNNQPEKADLPSTESIKGSLKEGVMLGLKGYLIYAFLFLLASPFIYSSVNPDDRYFMNHHVVFKVLYLFFNTLAYIPLLYFIPIDGNLFKK